MTYQAILERQLNYLAGVRERRYRPLIWRSLIPVDTSVPPWAETVEVSVTDSFTKIEPMGRDDTTVPLGTVSGSSVQQRLWSFKMGMRILNLDLLRAQQTGINISAKQAVANLLGCEQYLDTLAAVGDSRLQQPNNGGALKGLLNQTDVDATLTPTGGGTTWANIALAADARYLAILTDLNNLVYRVSSNSKMVYEADTVLLPPAQYELAATTRHSTTQRSALSVFQEGKPRVSRVIPWVHCAGAGAESADRAVAYEMNEQVARFLLVQELQDEPQLREAFGYLIPQTMRAGGMMCEGPAGIAYLDGI